MKIVRNKVEKFSFFFKTIPYLETLRARSNYEKELNLIEKERTYTYPIDTSKFTYFDEKLYDAEKNVDWKEHIDFVKNELSQFKGTGQLYYFLEAIGQGLAKNPYLSIEEKKDEIARYVQYFIYKKENIIMLQLITAEQFSKFEKSEYATRMQDRKSRKADVHNPEGVNPIITSSQIIIFSIITFFSLKYSFCRK